MADFQCAQCNHRQPMPDNYVGRSIRCPKCQSVTKSVGHAVSRAQSQTTIAVTVESPEQRAQLKADELLAATWTKYDETMAKAINESMSGLELGNAMQFVGCLLLVIVLLMVLGPCILTMLFI